MAQLYKMQILYKKGNEKVVANKSFLLLGVFLDFLHGFDSDLCSFFIMIGRADYKFCRPHYLDQRKQSK